MNFPTIEQLYQVFLRHPTIATDTRNIHHGSLFFALKGANFNGNTFAEEALQAGASLVVADEPLFAPNDKIWMVPDVLETLQQLAKHHRQQFNMPVLAITGSNGKTTTKELVHAVLSTVYNTYTTYGNLNNHIGVPITLLNIKPGAEIAVVEMGANHQKEIESYCTYTMPTHGIISNIGKAHLEGFGGIEGVKKGKGELFDYLRMHQGTAFACHNLDYLHQMTKGLNEVHWYGSYVGEVTGTVVESNPFIKVEIQKGFEEPFIISTQLVGDYNLFNILAACTIGRHFEIPADQIKEAIEAYTPSNSRSQLIEKNGNKVILDAYNANPASMKAAIENFAHLEVPNKMLFLGAMMELGPESAAEHAALLELVAKYTWKQVVLVGGDFGNVNHPYSYFDNAGLAAEWWKSQPEAGNYLLIKGSRSMKMETIAG